MSEGNTAAASSGIGIFGLMFIALFVGKVFEIGQVATWSWWIITAPLWGFPVFLISIPVVLIVLGTVVTCLAYVLKRIFG